MPAVARGLHKRGHQATGDAPVLPVVRHHDGEFTDMGVRERVIARHAHLQVLVLLGDHGHQCHFTVVVDLREAGQRFGRDFLQRIHETQVLAALGQVVHELAFQDGVFGPDRPDDQLRAITQVAALHQFARIGVDRHVVERPRRLVVRRDDDARIDSDYTVRAGDHRVHVHLDNGRQLRCKFRDPQQHFDQRLAVHLGRAARGFEQLGGLGAADQAPRQEVVQGWQRHFPVAQYFDQGSTQAETDGRTEHFVANHADHQFPPVTAGPHRLDHHAVETRFRHHLADRGHHFLVGVAHVTGRRQTEAHAADIGFVGDVRGVDFHRHRVAQFLGHQDRFLRGPRRDALGDGNMERSQDRLGLGLVKDPAAVLERVLDNDLGVFQLGFETLHHRAGHLQQLLLAVVVGSERRESSHRGFGRVVGRNVALLEHLPRPTDGGIAHPAGQHRLAGLLAQGAQPFRHIGRSRLRLGCQDHQHGVYVGRRQAGFDGLFIALRSGVPEDVDRVVVRPGFGQHCVQFFDGGLAEVGQGQAHVGAMVGRHDTRPSRVGNDRQPVAVGANPGRQRGRRCKKIGEVIDPQRTRAPQGRVEHGVRADQRAGMRNRRLRALLVTAGLHDHHRLGAGRGPQGAHEPA